MIKKEPIFPQRSAFLPSGVRYRRNAKPLTTYEMSGLRVSLPTVCWRTSTMPARQALAGFWTGPTRLPATHPAGPSWAAAWRSLWFLGRAAKPHPHRR